MCLVVQSFEHDAEYCPKFEVSLKTTEKLLWYRLGLYQERTIHRYIKLQ